MREEPQSLGSFFNQREGLSRPRSQQTEVGLQKPGLMAGGLWTGLIFTPLFSLPAKPDYFSVPSGNGRPLSLPPQVSFQ